VKVDTYRKIKINFCLQTLLSPFEKIRDKKRDQK